MKTTQTTRRTTANPRRTTLAHLKDLSELGLALAPAPVAEIHKLPSSTANPRRTVLNELPKAPEA